MSRKTWYRCKTCRKDTRQISLDEYLCSTCDEIKTRAEVEAGRNVKPGRSGRPLAPTPTLMSSMFDEIHVPSPTEEIGRPIQYKILGGHNNGWNN